jgi:4-hydroxy-3-methylbut-2-enyl diphosphate reductase
MKVVIDPGAGFCPGVRKVIQKAEELLTKPSHVYSLGQVIHNQEETDRLRKLGLKILDHSQISSRPRDSRNITLLIRAHGEPPQTMEIIRKNQLQAVDGTCSIVRNSQKLASRYFEKGFQVVIVGKKNHPETIGINGYCQNHAIIIEKPEDLKFLPPDKPLFVMAQTTAHPVMFEAVCETLEEEGFNFVQHNTICKYIKNREAQVSRFARNCDAVIVAGGKNSSNTGVLFRTCLAVNPLTYRIERPDEIQVDWFKQNCTVGITGGASTPPWLMEDIKKKLLKIFPARE